MKPMKFGIGQSVRRVEDVRLISGLGQYTTDYAPQGMLHSVVLRSPHAHAGIKRIDTTASTRDGCR